MSVTVIGDAFIDIILPVPNIEPGGTYHHAIHTFCGGSATTAINITRLGEKASFLGRVGDDAMGKYFRENLKENKVKDMTITDSDRRTGLCVAMTYPDGERSMVADRGANDSLCAQDIGDRINAIARSGMVYLSGYSLARMDTEETLTVLKRCRERGGELWFNPGAPNMVTASLNRTIYQFFDAVIMNFDEARNFAGTDNLPEMAAALEPVARLIVITTGREGCLIIRAGQRVAIGTRAVPGVRDTTGAGDAFSAGFMVGRLRHLPDTECARLANRTAALFLKEKERLSR